jgi:tRNA(Ile)-lysidine synthase
VKLSLSLKIQLSEETKLYMPKHLAVAWSGGADSTALILQLIAEGYAVSAWHINHNWHSGSTKVAIDLAEQAKVWDIPFYVLNTEKPKQNIEAEARLGRYAAFEALAKQTGCFDLALGHHADDQAETVCMRLLQGSGVAGCQGMKVHRKHGDLSIWRPILNVPRHSFGL